MWSFGKILLLTGALAVTFFVFAGIAMRVAVRARQVTVPDFVGKSTAEATALLSGRCQIGTSSRASFFAEAPPGPLSILRPARRPEQAPRVPRRGPLGDSCAPWCLGC